MAKAYSNDLRRKLLEAYDRGEGSLRELAERFGVSSPYAWKISAQRKRTGRVERVEQRHGPESKVTETVQQQLRTWVRQQPDLTLLEIQERLWETEGLPVSLSRLWQVLRRLQLRLKKKSLHAQEQNTPQNQRRRAAWRAALSEVDPARLVFLDESGVTTEMTRRYGRAPSGERVREATSSGTLEHAHAAGCPDEPGNAGQHDGGIVHRWRGVTGLSGGSLVPLPATGTDRDRRQSLGP